MRRELPLRLLEEDLFVTRPILDLRMIRLDLLPVIRKEPREDWKSALRAAVIDARRSQPSRRRVGRCEPGT